MDLQYRLLSFLSFLCIFLLFLYFLRPLLRGSARHTALLAGAVLLLCAAGLLAEPALGLTPMAGSTLRAMGLLAAAALLGRRLTSATLPQILFFVLFPKGYSENMLMLVTVTVESLQLHFPGAYVWGYLLCMLVTMPLVLLNFTPVVYPLLRDGAELPFWRSLWLIPLTLCLLYYIASYTDYVRVVSLNYRTWAAMLILIWNVCTISLYYLILKMLQGTSDALHWRTDAQCAALQLKLQREQMQTLQSGIEESQRIRHDIRHHMVVLKKFVQSGNREGLLDYLSQYESSLEQDNAPRLCANDALDAVLGHYYRLCRAGGIRFRAEFPLPPDLGEGEAALCILLGNLLENAWEECQRLPEGQPRWVQVKGSTVNAGMLALTVRNSCRGELRMEGEHLLSSKHSGRGTGTDSVRHIAETRGGSARFTLIRPDTFEAAILLRRSGGSPV